MDTKGPSTTHQKICEGVTIREGEGDKSSNIKWMHHIQKDTNVTKKDRQMREENKPKRIMMDADPEQ